MLLSLSFHSLVSAQYFSKITTGAVVTDLGDSRSVNWVDVNNDGYIDCFISNGPSGGQNNRLYLNMGDGTFSAVTDDDIVTDGAPSDGATFADIDNDGDLDAFVVNWYNVNNLLYINDGNGNFTRITSGPPVSDLGYSETASFGDYNNDGLIDLYVTNSAGAKKNFLYQNSGAGTWLKITTGSPVEDNLASRNVSWTDLNEDGYPDMFVTNEYGANEHIYINNGDGAFETHTTGTLVNNGGNTNSSSWGDYGQ
ncbi:MAG: VCBS repeat-containing protein [Taibaiella sp.]|nr:VCBS repeat-containing protein [Taibaiella sp.]